MQEVSAVVDPLLPTLMMSLHPEYVEEIKCGKKKIEYRKKFYKYPFQAFVYTTGTDGGVELFLQCDGGITGDAKKLATVGTLIQNDDFEEIYKYFAGKNSGTIIPIVKAEILAKRSIHEISHLWPDFKAPQSYYFLDTMQKDQLFSYMKEMLVLREIKNDWDAIYRTLSR